MTNWTKVLLLHDGTLSATNQCKALARAMGCPASGMVVQHAKIKPAFRRLPPWLHIPLSLVFRDPYFGYEGERVANVKDMDAVVACGRTTVPLAGTLTARRRLNESLWRWWLPSTADQVEGPTVVIHHPRCGFPLNRVLFDAIVTPVHDLSADTRPYESVKGNIVPTVGSVSTVPGRLSGSTETRRDVVVLLGGVNRYVKDLDFVLEDMRTLLHAGGFQRIHLVGSRRTPEKLWETSFAMAERCSRERNLDFEPWSPSSSTTPNPYQDLMRTGALYLVTPDSIAMISDACSTGQPVVVLGARRFLEQVNSKNKFHRFVSYLLDNQYVMDSVVYQRADAVKIARLSDAQCCVKPLERLLRSPNKA